MTALGNLNKRRLSILILFVLGSCIAFALFAGQGENLEQVAKGVVENRQRTSVHEEHVQDRSILIRLGPNHFDPLRKLPEQKAGIPAIESYEDNQVGYYIVQFDGPVKDAWKKDLVTLGAEVFDYVPEYAFVIRMNSGDEHVVRALPHVRWLGIYQPSYKMSQPALDAMYTKGGKAVEDGVSYEDLRITIFPGEDLGRLKSQITALGGTITDTASTRWKTTLRVRIPANRIGDLAPLTGIKWVEPIPRWKPFNNVSTDIMNVRTPRDTQGLYGEGQTVGICDTGLDQGSTDPATLHDDFEDGSGNSRVLQIFDRVGDGANDVNLGHGTHVAGSVLGNGTQTPLGEPTPFAGIAPRANLIFQAAEENATEELSGIPVDLNALFSQAVNAGADLHTNSWGSATSGMYTSYSEDVDEFIWDNPDFLILFAAGNEGIDKDGDGVIDLYSVGGPATAKNCLTVGASEGNRPSGAGYDFAWGSFNPYEYSMDPIFSDHLSDDPSGMAAFSARGPVLDGRYKPDLVAPGTNILSTRSSVATQPLWADYDEYYAWSGGSSMATPLAAGAAALVREYLIKERGYTAPSAALIKAALLNSAEDISPGQYGTGPIQEIPDPPVPNNVQGWGRLNLGNGVYPASPFNIIYHDERNGLNTGEYLEYRVSVSDAGNPLKINLVWTDYPGSPAVQGGLVNDLDLQITDPSSTIHYPDNASQKSTVSSLEYNDGEPEYFLLDNRWAIRFTPTVYPAYVESMVFFLFNTTGTTSDVDVVVYDDDGAGGLPGTELFRKTLTYVPSGVITTGITGVVINSGDFYVAVEKNDMDQYLFGDDRNPTGRSYFHDGSAWVRPTPPVTPYIMANVRGADISTSFDRINNAVGLTLINPVMGVYTIRVSGFNVPQGPQGYALVISGGVTGSPTVTTGPATSVTSTSATLNGTVNPNGLSTTYYFEYGLTPSYGNQTPQTDAGSGLDKMGVSETITVSDPMATYYYRLVATNTLGTSYGEEMNFTNDADMDSMPDDWERQIIDDDPGDGITRIEDVLPGDDYDGDGLTNQEEYQQATVPTDSDTDDDGLSDGDEVKTHNTDPLDPDTDGDLMPDGWEVTYGLNPRSSQSPNGAADDPDGDGLTNLEEYILGRHPNNYEPDKPVLLSPPNTPNPNVSLTPTLMTDAFSDTDGDAHAMTRWQVSRVQGNFSDSALVMDALTNPHLTSFPLPYHVLGVGTPYYWRAKFYDDRNASSAWSDEWRFDTVPLDPRDPNGDGVPEDQEMDDPSVDLDEDGTPDMIQADMKCVNTVIGNAQVSVKQGTNVVSIDSLSSVDPATISDAQNRPDDMPIGLTSFRLTVNNPGDTAEVTLYFSIQVPNRWYKWDPVNGWQDYSANAAFSANGKSVTLQLTDGGMGDLDGTANGFIIDPSGPGAMLADGDSGGGGGGGGCFIATLANGFPLAKIKWVLILLLGCGVMGLVEWRKKYHQVR